MALVREIIAVTKERQTLHEETTCTSSILTDEEGWRYIQLDTYGSRRRKLHGKVSQAIQFNEVAAGQLKRLIETVFPNLR